MSDDGNPKIVYGLSERFDYSQLVVRDSGPKYASAYGWKCCKLSAVATAPDDIVIIDTRVQEEELPALHELVDNAKGPIFFQLVDSYNECRGQAYVKFLLDLAAQRHLYFLLPYQPEDMALELAKRHGFERILVLPYAYETARELSRPLATRKKRIVVSGNMGTVGYPFRAAFHKATYHKAWSLFRTRHLPHCGYRELTGKVRHHIIGDRYVEFMSQHVFMLLCPGRLRFEFLKYAECGYAGCVPVGQRPASFDMPDNCFIEVDPSDIRASVNAIFRLPPERLTSVAGNYRQWMRQHRSSPVLNRRLQEFLHISETARRHS